MLRLIVKKQTFATSNNKHIVVIGSGLMGSGIAQVSANAGYKVTMVDSQQSSIEKGFNFP
jgi:3-hydroxyacyl-CoA dehydrogenase